MEKKKSFLKKRTFFVLCFILIVILYLITRVTWNNIPFMYKIIYTAPTQEQVNKFISKNSINVLTVKETSDFSVILFENKEVYGHYVLYQDQNNKLYDTWVKGYGNQEKNPVSLGGVASGKIPFVTVIINDEDIIKKAKEIEVTFEDGGVVVEKISGKGTIVCYKNEKNGSPMSYIRLVIYDKDRNIVYEF